MANEIERLGENIWATNDVEQAAEAFFEEAFQVCGYDDGWNAAVHIVAPDLLSSDDFELFLDLDGHISDAEWFQFVMHPIFFDDVLEKIDEGPEPEVYCWWRLVDFADIAGLSRESFEEKRAVAFYSVCDNVIAVFVVIRQESEYDFVDSWDASEIDALLDLADTFTGHLHKLSLAVRYNSYHDRFSEHVEPPRTSADLIDQGE